MRNSSAKLMVWIAIVIVVLIALVSWKQQYPHAVHTLKAVDSVKTILKVVPPTKVTIYRYICIKDSCTYRIEKIVRKSW